MNKPKLNIKIGIKEIILITVFIFVIWFALQNWEKVSTLISQKERLENWINGFGNWKYIIFILIQIIQVVIFIIPGEVVFISGGYLFGSFLASILSIIGIILGSLICFGIARTLGQPLVGKFMSKHEMKKLKAKVNTRNTAVTLFFIFIIPGLPGKDALTYIAGLTPIKLLDFFLVVLVARSPWIIVASFWGSSLEKGNYITLIIVTVLVSAAFIIGVFKGERFIRYISKRRSLKKIKK